MQGQLEQRLPLLPRRIEQSSMGSVQYLQRICKSPLRHKFRNNDCLSGAHMMRLASIQKTLHAIRIPHQVEYQNQPEGTVLGLSGSASTAGPEGPPGDVKSTQNRVSTRGMMRGRRRRQAIGQCALAQALEARTAPPTALLGSFASTSLISLMCSRWWIDVFSRPCGPSKEQ